MLRRLGADEYDILAVQNNIAKSYQALGRFKEASSIFRDVYSGELKLYGAEHSETLKSAINYAASLHNQKCFEEAKSTLRKILPAAQRVLGENLGLPRELWIENFGGSRYWSVDCWGPVLICIHRWKRPRMRCRRLTMSSSDPRRLQGDLGATNRQVAIDAAVMVGPSITRIKKYFFRPPGSVPLISLDK